MFYYPEQTEPSFYDAEQIAASLYDGGWRAEDREQLIDEYEFTEAEADEIVAILRSYEND